METELRIIDSELMERRLAFIWQHFRQNETEMERLAEEQGTKLSTIFGIIAVKFLAYER